MRVREQVLGLVMAGRDFTQQMARASRPGKDGASVRMSLGLDKQQESGLGTQQPN